MAGLGAQSQWAGAQSSRPDTKKQMKINLAWQIALEEVGFSPGIIDGNFGRKGHQAMEEYAARYFPNFKPLDPKVYQALQVDIEHALAQYKIADEDAAEVGPLPEDWNEKAQLDKLPYDSLADCLAEKFHCTKGLLTRLNPGVNIGQLTVGQEINVPHLRPFPAPGPLAVPPLASAPTTPRDDPEPAPASHPTVTTATATHTASAPATRNHKKAKVEGAVAAYITINLTQKCIRVYDQDDRQMVLLHCSVAKDKAKLPARDTTIKVMADNPQYTFDPKMWPDVSNVDRTLQIPPGPRNPVGLAWIGLDLTGYGIHGNPKPELIGKTGSHGCFRLTNWDALRLYSMVHKGMKVKIINPEIPGVTTPD